MKINEPRSDEEITAKAQLAFDACKRALVEQFDGNSSGDYENCVWIVQNLAFMALSNGCRLSREEATDCLKIFNDRLQTQINKSLPPRNEHKH